MPYIPTPVSGAMAATLVARLEAQRAEDEKPCPSCGGDRLRADFVDPTRCHVPRTAA